MVRRRVVVTVGSLALLIGAAFPVSFPGQGVNGQGSAHQDDVCDQLPDPPGNGHGIEKKCPGAGSSSGVARGDFNGDGFADLAVGVKGKDTPSTVTNSGAVIVIYGSAAGLNPAGGAGVPASQFWSQNTTGVPDTSESGDDFGAALAAGDFNDDDFSDLAIGVPDDKVVAGGRANHGQVTVIYGSPAGLTTSTTGGVPAPQRWVAKDVDNGQLPAFEAETESDIPENQSFGSALAWGDFDGDGVGDLAIGMAAADVGVLGVTQITAGAGAVGVLYGDRNAGLSSARRQVWTLNTPGVADTDLNISPVAQQGDGFGTALSAGDFDGDGRSDLAIGIPERCFCHQNLRVLSAGAVEVLFGTGTGLTADGDVYFEAQFSNPAFAPGEDDELGSSLATGDFDADGRDDLVIGVPLRNLSGLSNAGTIIVQYSTLGGLQGPHEFWHQNRIFGDDDPVFESVNEAGDHFGAALAGGDFDNDGYDDLAIGVPFEDVYVDRGTFFENISNAGEVNILYGSGSRLSTSSRAPQIFRQSTVNIEDDAESGDLFGFSLTAWNFGRNETIPNPRNPSTTVTLKTTDLAIGVVLENIGTVADAGAVNVIYGLSGFGLTSSNDQFFHQGLDSIPGENVAGDGFGQTVY